MSKIGFELRVRGLKNSLASWQAGAIIVGLSLLSGLGLFWSYSLHVQSATDFSSEKYLQAVAQLIHTTQSNPSALSQIEKQIQNAENQGKALRRKHASRVVEAESAWKAWQKEWLQNQRVSTDSSQELLLSALAQNFAIQKAEQDNNTFRLNILWMGLSVLLIPAAYGLRLLAKLKQVEQHLVHTHQVASDRHTELEAQQEMLLANEEELERTATRLMTSNELLIQVSRRFETLFHGLPIACLAFDTELTVHEWNPAFETVFDFATPALFHANVLAILQQRNCVGLNEHELTEVLSGETLEGVENEITFKNGQKRQFLSSLFPMRNEKGEVIAAICAFLDITSRKKMEVEIKTSNERYEFALECSNTSLFELDMESRELYLSKNLEVLLGYDEEEFEKTYANFLAHIHPEDLSIAKAQFKNHVEEQEPYDIMFRLRTKNGHYKWFQSTGVVKKSSDSQQEHFLGIITEITNLKEAIDKLESLAYSDGLTGVANHRVFQQDLEQEFVYAVEHGQALSVALLDIDHFKSSSDEFGYQVGDEVLKQFAAILRKMTSEHNILVARYGGDEFALLMPGLGRDEASLFAECIRQAIENAEWSHRKVTSSVGVSTLCAQTENRTQLIREADEALYASKRIGRNQVTHFDELQTDSKHRSNLHKTA